jgi:hypothetical protein
MTTPSGQISLNDVNVELGFAGTTLIQMNQANVRTLAGVGGSGTVISMQNLQNKTNRVAISFTFTSNSTDSTLNLSAISGYVSGKSDITVTINSGVYLYATSTGNYALAISGGTTGDTLTIVNNGFILGRGGNGGAVSSNVGASGGPALNLGFGMSACTINNTNGSAYIAGGGGGGGGGFSTNVGGGAGGGGGGAGAGTGGTGGSGSGGAGGGVGASGSNGGGNSGGGGGRILPGSGGGGGGGGGGAGGGGGTSTTNNSTGKSAGTASGGAGGSSNAGGGNAANFANGAGGGGGAGWGSSGGSSNVGGGSGGKAVNLNGKSLTWTSGNTTRVYGAVS